MSMSSIVYRNYLLMRGFSNLSKSHSLREPLAVLN